MSPDPPAIRSEADLRGGSARPRLLVVDDDLDFRARIVDALQGQDVSLVFRSDGDVARVEAQRRPPVALLLDVDRPRGGGLALVAALREHPKTGSIPIVVLTASADPELRARSLELGVRDLIAKSIDPIELAIRLRALLPRATSARRGLERDAAPRLPLDAERRGGAEWVEAPPEAKLEDPLEDPLEAIPIGLVLSSKEGEVIRCNRRAHELLALSAEDAGERARRDPDARVRSTYQALIAQARSMPQGELSWIAGEGGRARHLLLTTGSRQGEGRITAVTDVSAVQRSRDARDLAESFLSAAMEASSARVAIFDLEGTILAVNQAWRAGCGAAEGLEGEDAEVGERYLGFDAARLPPGLRSLPAQLQALLRGEHDPVTLECDVSGQEPRWIRLRLSLLEREGVGFGVAVHEEITERKLAEEALRRRESEQRAIVDALPDLMFRLSAQGVFLDAHVPDESPAGLPWRDALGAHIADVLPAGVSADAFRAMAIALQTGKTSSFDFCMEIAGTGLRYFEARVARSAPDQVLMVIHDVSGRVRAARAEAALRVSEARYRTLVETAPDMITVLSPDGVVEFASHPSGGSDSKAEIGLRWADFVVDASRESFEAAFARALASESIVTCELRMCFWQGPERHLQTRMRRILELGRRKILLFSTDVTAQKAQEEALRRSEARFRDLLDRAPIPIAVLGNDREIAYANEAMGDVFGQAVDALVGSDGLGSIAAEDREHVRGAIDAALGGDSRTLELRIARPDGRRTVLQATSAPVDFDGGLSVLILGIDLTDRRSLEAQLALSDRLASVGALAAGVAHEINNPLTYVIENLRMARLKLGGAASPREPERDAPLAELLADASDGADRVRKIVGGLRTFARIEEDEQFALDLGLVLENTVRLARNQLRYRACLVVQIAEGLPQIMANEGRISQVVLNLLINAGQAIAEGCPEENEIRLDAFEREGSVVIEISDTGRGIAPEHLENLFDPFFTTKPVGEGSGLGLAVCHGIVVGLGGRMEVSSRVGYGSTFRVLLPVYSRDSKAPPVELEFLEGDALIPLRILLVEDDAPVRTALRRALEEYHQIHEASSCAEARAILGSNAPIDVLLTDLMMQDGTGAQLYEWVEANRPGLADRTLFVSGGGVTRSVNAFLADHAKRLIHKPVDMRQLLARLQELAALRAADSEQPLRRADGA
ncbi:MAG: PAS domain S-box protein [Myxococcales bacterium]|nr:PAS domain S-box protein [Myxococcales bacterium]